jgi:KDO2-lipid IV(A) lauroyltransferase
MSSSACYAVHLLLPITFDQPGDHLVTELTANFRECYRRAGMATLRQRLEYALVWLLVRVLGALPRWLARAGGIVLAWSVYALHFRLRRVGMHNLAIAFPEKSPHQRRQILRKLFTGLGRQLAEFCHFPSYTRENVARVAVHDGMENYEAARARGKGVLFLTGHFGGWELGSFVHSIVGYPMQIVVRELDNPHVNHLVTRYRCLQGNSVVDKDEFARGLLAAMRNGETVGILMDTNMTPPQGVFVDFFGVPACTASGLARVALKTGAAVVPGFTLWDPQLGKYRVQLLPALELICTGDYESDVVANTQLFTNVIERFARRYPEQWLWVHRRWKTRPEGTSSIY